MPNLGGLPLKAQTGVTVHPDGSATLTPDEWAGLSWFLEANQSSTAPAPAPAASTSRTTRVVHDDDSSDDDDEAAPAPEAPAPKRRSRPVQVKDDDPLYMPDLLKADELALILKAIGGTDDAKKTACEDAASWCMLNKEHKAVCDSHPEVWKDLAERIFKYTPTDANDQDLEGEGLIYTTFLHSYDEATRNEEPDMQQAFKRMCTYKGLADVVAKRFVLYAIDKFEVMMWEHWYNTRADVTGMGEAVENLDGAEEIALAKDIYPDLARTSGWDEEARQQFEAAPPMELFVDMYQKDGRFTKAVDRIFISTAKYLFEDPKSMLTYDEDNEGPDRQINKIYAIAEIVGVYVVCIAKLDLDIVKTYLDEWLGSDDLKDERVDAIHEVVDAMRMKFVTAVYKTLEPSIDLEEDDDLDWFGGRYSYLGSEMAAYEDTDGHFTRYEQ